MRKLAVAVLVVFMLVVALLGIGAYRLDALLDENREWLAEQASEASGREVGFASTRLSFRRGLAVRVTDLRIAEDARFGSEDFAQVAETYVRIRLLPLLSGNVEVASVELDQPRFRLVRTRAGLNTDSLAGASEGDAGGESSTGVAVLVSALRIADGQLDYVDRSAQPPLMLRVEDLDASGSDLAATGPVALSLSGNIRSLTGAQEESVASAIDLEVELDDIETLAGTIVAQSPRLELASLGLTGENEVLEDVNVVATLVPGSSDIQLDIVSSAGVYGGFAYEEASGDIVYAGDDIRIDRFSVGVAGGQVETTGNVRLGDRVAYDLDADLGALDSGFLATALFGLPAGALSSDLGGKVQLKGSGTEWEDIKRALTGNVDLQLGEGELTGINIVQVALGGLEGIPGLGTLAASELRDAAPELLNSSSTRFDTAHLALAIRDGMLLGEQLKMAASDYLLSGDGSLSLDGALDLGGVLALSAPVSGALEKKVKQLSFLKNADERIGIPVRVSGSFPNIQLQPDVEAMTASLSGGLQKEVVGKLSRKLGGLSGIDIPGDEGEDSAPPAKKLLEDGLGRLLGR